MKLYLIGTGTEGRRTLTAEAAEAIASSGLLIGGARILEPFRDTKAECICTYKTDEIVQAIRHTEHGIVSVLFSGDCGFFSGAKKLLAALPDADITVLPGISSAAAFCAKIGKTYENMRFVSLHGTKANIAIEAATHESRISG